jgi:outer membrane protein TolC
MVRSFIFFSLGLLGLIEQHTHAADVIRLSVDDLPELVHEKNQNVAGSERLIESAQARTGHLVRSFLPSLRLDVGGETFQTGPYATWAQPYGGAELRLNLFRGGKDLLEEHARSAQVSASGGTAKQTLAGELAQARKLYWEIIYSREMVKTLGAAVDQNEKLLEMANRRIARGLSTETDRLEFQIHRSQLNEEIESLTHGVKLLQMSLSAVLGMTTDTEFLTVESVPHVHDEALLGSTFDPSSHPEVTFLKASQEVARSQGSQASRWWMPSLDAYAGYSLYTLRDRDYLAQGLRDDQVVGLRLSFELFDGFQSKVNAASLSLQADAYELQSTQRTRSVNAQVEVAKEALKHDHELIHRIEERIVQGQDYWKRILGEYERGVKNTGEALAAAQKYLGFQKQNIERRRDYQVTKSQLLSLLGQ